jgi:hypothetical protein
MAVEVYCGGFNVPTSNGSHAETGIGFQPDALILIVTRASTVTGTTDSVLGVGMATSASDEFVWSTYMDDGDTTTKYHVGYETDACVLRLKAPNTSATVRANLTSLDADGFTLNFSTTSSGYRLQYIAIGGLVDAKVVEIAAKTTTGTQAYTGVGFQPDALVICQTNRTATGVARANVFFGFGMSDGTNDFSAAFFGDDNVGTTIEHSKVDTGSAVLLVNSSGVLLEANVDSLDSDGFTLDFTTASGAAPNAFVLCLKGGQYSVGNDTQPTSVGTKATTGTGFTPVGLVTISANTVNESNDNDGQFGIGAVGPAVTDDWAYYIAQDGGASNSNNGSELVTDSCVINGFWTPAINSEGHLDSFDSNGFTIDWSDADSSQRIFGYLAIGDDADPVVAEVISNSQPDRTPPVPVPYQ